MRDLDLVKFALNNLNGDEMRSISDSFSPNFTFSTPRFKSLNFAQYCAYIDFVSSILKTNVNKITSDGDIFTIDVNFDIIDNASNYQKNLSAIGTVIMHDNLIQSLNISYTANQLDLKVILKIAASIVRHFKNMAICK